MLAVTAMKPKLSKRNLNKTSIVLFSEHKKIENFSLFHSNEGQKYMFGKNKSLKAP